MYIGSSNGFETTPKGGVRMSEISVNNERMCNTCQYATVSTEWTADCKQRIKVVKKIGVRIVRHWLKNTGQVNMCPFWKQL